MFRTTALALALALAPTAASAAPATADHTAQVVQLDHISVQAMGEGDPVILIPGLSSPRAVWSGVAPAIARNHRVYLVQVNGFAGGDPRANLQPGILDGVVADLHGLIVENKLNGAKVVGHSMGGLAALMLARTHPDDASALMIVDALPYVGEIFVPGATVAQVEPRAAQMREQMKAAYGQPANPAVAAAIAESQAVKLSSRQQVAKWIGAADARVSAQAMYEDMTTDLRPAMADIATPITVVYPWNDAMPKVRADSFYRTEYADAPKVDYVGIGDSGHFVMLDQPDSFARAVDAFLND